MKWIWPLIIGISAFAAYFVTTTQVPPLVRAVVSFWFLLICPGMALVRLLNLKEPLAEWVLAVALSLAISTIVAGLMVYTGRWSPENGLRTLILISLIGAALQYVTAFSYPVLRWLRSLGVRSSRKGRESNPDSSLYGISAYRASWSPDVLLFTLSLFTVIGGLVVIAYLF